MAKDAIKEPAKKTSPPKSDAEKKADDDKKKAERQKKDEQTLIINIRAVRQAMKLKDEEQRKTFIAPIKVRITKDRLKAEQFTDKEIEWIEANTDLTKAKVSGVAREKVDRVYPAKFAIYSEKDPMPSIKGVRMDESLRRPDKGMIEHGTTFNTNLKKFLKENEEHLDYFEKTAGEFWSTYWRTGEPTPSETVAEKK